MDEFEVADEAVVVELVDDDVRGLPEASLALRAFPIGSRTAPLGHDSAMIWAAEAELAAASSQAAAVAEDGEADAAAEAGLGVSPPARRRRGRRFVALGAAVGTAVGATVGPAVVRSLRVSVPQVASAVGRLAGAPI